MIPVTWSSPPKPTAARRKANGLVRYIYRWGINGRKGQSCRVTARGSLNSILAVFDDGFAMVTSANAIRRDHSITLTME